MFKQIAYSLLQGNAVGYAENPNVWIQDASALTRKLLAAVELYSNEATNVQQDS